MNVGRPKSLAFVPVWLDRSRLLNLHRRHSFAVMTESLKMGCTSIFHENVTNIGFQCIYARREFLQLIHSTTTVLFLHFAKRMASLNIGARSMRSCKKSMHFTPPTRTCMSGVNSNQAQPTSHRMLFANILGRPEAHAVYTSRTDRNRKGKKGTSYDVRKVL